MRQIERQVMLQLIDQRWRDHLKRDGPPAGGHPPACHGPEGPAHRMAAEGFEMFGEMMHVARRLRPVHHARRGGGRASPGGDDRRRQKPDLTVTEPTPSPPEPPRQPPAVPAAAGAGRSRRRTRQRHRGRSAESADDTRPAQARGQGRVGQDPSQRPLPVRERQEVQAVSRHELAADHARDDPEHCRPSHR